MWATKKKKYSLCICYYWIMLKCMAGVKAHQSMTFSRSNIVWLAAITIWTHCHSWILDDPWGALPKQGLLKDLRRWCSLYSSFSAGRSGISMSMEMGRTTERERPAEELGLYSAVNHHVAAGLQPCLLPFTSFIGNLWSVVLGLAISSCLTFRLVILRLRYGCGLNFNIRVNWTSSHLSGCLK